MKSRYTKNERKVVLIYSGELMLFAAIFLVLGFLKTFGVMTYNETRRIVFNWITLFGALWPITDLTWALASKNRRKRVCLLDKFLVLPLPIFLITFDLISLISKPTDTNFYIFSIAAAFFYVSAIYLFQSIYHYFKPLKELMDEIHGEEEQEKLDEEKSSD